jgi:limonene 1,2-monooxygenase
MQLLEHLDQLGFDEAWIGEHHSAGWEIIASPEVFIAAAAMRTRHIRLGTGVVSLPYHHPFMVADRIVLLDHLTRGRVMLGVGPGALPSDAAMLGIEATEQRDRMDEALGVILRLLAGETVDHTSSWFTLRQARLQLAPYQERIPVAVASMFSPAGMKTAGRYGAAVLSIGAFVPGGLVNAAAQWKIAETYAEECGNKLDRAEWRLVIPVHLAPTREQAVAEAAEHIQAWIGYFGFAMGRPFPLPPDISGQQIVQMLTSTGAAIVGSPDDAVAAITKLGEVSGGFGGLLCLAHEWTSFENTKRSYELLARYVMPEFTFANARTKSSMRWVNENFGEIAGRSQSAMVKAFSDHEAHMTERRKPRE